ncbi:MAG: nucleotidyltransferase domain-containing protein [Candidatus Bathyarchaeia archaeon]|nr:nucleotidyltransferase domain-containing protein [Candidatus Bathyarchaeota archaeon]
MREKSLEYRKLIEAVEKIKSGYKVVAAILFGFRARGDFKPWSDYDLLVIADFKERYLDRITNLLEVISDVKLNIELHPYTLDEAVEMLRKGNLTLVDALSEGVILYQNEDFNILRSTYKELVKRGLKKTNTTVIVPYP